MSLPGTPTRGDAAPEYSAFLSYSREDSAIGGHVHRALEEFGGPQFHRHRPFVSTRVRRVFRDVENVGAAENLPEELRQAMEASEYFVLLASPRASRRPWIDDEIRFWLARHEGRARQFLIVLCDGDATWDREQKDFDWTKTTALPPVLRGRFDEEPAYCDLRPVLRSGGRLKLRNSRFRNAIAEVVARLDDRNKVDLVGRHLKVRRRIFTGASIVLLAVAALAGGFANRQIEVRRQGEIAAARQQLAEAVEVFTATGDPDQWAGSLRTALADAQAAIRTLNERLPELAPGDESYIRAVLATLPGAVTRLPVRGISSALVSDDGRRVLLVTQNDSVRLWDVASRSVIAELGDVRPVFDGGLRTFTWQDASGRLIVDVSGVRIEAARRVRAPVTPRRVSPSGELVAYTDSAGALYVEDVSRGRPPVRLCGRTDGETVAFSRDDRRMAAVCDDTLQVWASGTALPVASFPVKPAYFVDATFSDDGMRIALASTRRVHLWSLDPNTLLTEQLIVTDPEPDSEDLISAIALDPGGTRVAVTFGNVIMCVDLLGGDVVWPRIAAWDFAGRGRSVSDFFSRRIAYRDVPEGFAVHDVCSGARIARVVVRSPLSARTYNDGAQQLALVTADSGEVVLVDLHPADLSGSDVLAGEVRAVAIGQRAGAPVQALVTAQHLRVWDLERGLSLLQLDGDFANTDIALSDDGAALAVLRADTLDVWRCLRGPRCQTGARARPASTRTIIPGAVGVEWMQGSYLVVATEFGSQLHHVTPVAMTRVVLPESGTPVEIHAARGGTLGLLLVDSAGERLLTAQLRGGAVTGVRTVALGARGAFTATQDYLWTLASSSVVVLDGKKGRWITTTTAGAPVIDIGVKAREYPLYEVSRDGRWLALATNPSRTVPEPTDADTVEVVDLATGRVVSRIPFETHVARMRFGVTGRLAVAGNAVVKGEAGFRVQVFQPPAWQPLTNVQAAGRPECLSFGANDTRLAVGQRDNTTVVLDKGGVRQLVIPQAGRVVVCELSADALSISTIGSTTDLTTLRVTPASRKALARRLLDAAPWVP